MKKIKSFTVNHDTLKKGIYVSRVDGDVVTYDIRMKKPNEDDYLSYGTIHTFEHLFATYARNSEFSEYVIYVGPMGCRTGFYLLLRDKVTRDDVLLLLHDTFTFIAGYQGEIPGRKPYECGNWREHDLAGAQDIANDMLEVLSNWSAEKMDYEYTDTDGFTTSMDSKNSKIKNFVNK